MLMIIFIMTFSSCDLNITHIFQFQLYNIPNRHKLKSQFVIKKTKKNNPPYNKYREFPMDNGMVKSNDHVYFIRTFIAKELIFKGTCNVTPIIILNVYQVGFY